MSLFSLVNGWEAEPGGDRNGFVQIQKMICLKSFR